MDSSETRERERLKQSFRNTLTIMERMGVPRPVLVEVIEAVLVDIREEMRATVAAPKATQ